MKWLGRWGVIVGLWSMGFAQADPAAFIAPESATGLRSAESAEVFQRFAVAAAHPLAADAGVKVLKAGGNAVDAAVAVQMVLTLVEPQSSGIGGGAFMLLFDGKSTEAWDGRETAPAAADESHFMKPDGQPMAFYDGVVGGRSVGVPGVIAMLEMVHRRHGKLPWATLFQPAIALAEDGFRVTPRLSMLLEQDKYLRDDPVARTYFYAPDGHAWPVGHLLKNPALAQTLREIASGGSAFFYHGPIAREVVTKVRNHANVGRLAPDDLAAYRPVRRDPLCTVWRTFRVCGFPPPSSGGLAIAQLLGLLERRAPVGLESAGVLTPEWLHVYLEASRLVFADRGRYVGDPDFVPAPDGRWESLVAPAYLDRRAALIGEQTMGKALPGDPSLSNRPQAALADDAAELPATSHFSIVDGEGRALAMTSTIEDGFGARLMVGGFLLNNQLTDFSFVPNEAGVAVANRVQPGKRPRSSMSPTLVFDADSGQLLFATGSPGGAPIIHYTTKSLLGVLLWKLSPQTAGAYPNFASLNGPTLLEAGRFPAATIENLRARGHDVKEVPLTSGIHSLFRTSRGWAGGVDPRREGVVRGE